MKPYPHHYTASARAQAIGSVTIAAPALPRIETAPPPEFDGPGGIWSPEVLLCAAIADCFVLSFRGIARAAHFNWVALECRVEGTLERVGNATQFTRFATTARLTLPQGGDEEKAHQLLGRAERACLIANSLRGERGLSVEVVIDQRTDDLDDDPDDQSVDQIGGGPRPEEVEGLTGHPS